jgi:hypothetical protein
MGKTIFLPVIKSLLTLIVRFSLSVIFFLFFSVILLLLVFSALISLL